MRLDLDPLADFVLQELLRLTAGWCREDARGVPSGGWRATARREHQQRTSVGVLCKKNASFFEDVGGDGGRERWQSAHAEHPASDPTWTAGSADVARDFSWAPSAPYGGSPVHPAVDHLRTLAIAVVAMVALSGIVLAGPAVVSMVDDASLGGFGSPGGASTGENLADDTDTASATAGSVATDSPTEVPTPTPTDTSPESPTESPTSARTVIGC